MSALTLSELVDVLVAARRAGGFRYDGQARVLARFAAHYLRLDIEHLRCCALDVEDVLDAGARS